MSAKPEMPYYRNSWTGEPCLHDRDDLGRFEADVCHGCGTDFSEQTCTLCDSRMAVVGAHRLGDVALHVTLSRPWNEDARCLECVLDDLTRLVVGAPAKNSATTSNANSEKCARPGCGHPERQHDDGGCLFPKWFKTGGTTCGCAMFTHAPEASS